MVRRTLDQKSIICCRQTADHATSLLTSIIFCRPIFSDRALIDYKIATLCNMPMLIFSLSYGKLSVHSSSIKYSLLSFPPHGELYTIHSIIISWMEVCFSCIPGHRNQYICGCVCTLMHIYLCVYLRLCRSSLH